MYTQSRCFFFLICLWNFIQLRYLIILLLNSPPPLLSPLYLLLIHKILIIDTLIILDNGLNLHIMLKSHLLQLPHQLLVSMPFLKQLNRFLAMVVLQRLQQLWLLLALQRSRGGMEESEHRVGLDQGLEVECLNPLGSELLAGYCWISRCYIRETKVSRALQVLRKNTRDLFHPLFIILTFLKILFYHLNILYFLFRRLNFSFKFAHLKSFWRFLFSINVLIISIIPLHLLLILKLPFSYSLYLRLIVHFEIRVLL